MMSPRRDSTPRLTPRARRRTARLPARRCRRRSDPSPSILIPPIHTYLTSQYPSPIWTADALKSGEFDPGVVVDLLLHLLGEQMGRLVGEVVEIGVHLHGLEDQSMHFRLLPGQFSRQLSQESSQEQYLWTHCLADLGDVLVDLAIARGSGEEGGEVLPLGEEEEGESDGEGLFDTLVHLGLHRPLLLPFGIRILFAKTVGDGGEEVAEVQNDCQSANAQIMHHCGLQQYGQPWNLLILVEEFLDALDCDACDDRIGQFVIEVEEQFGQYAQVLFLFQGGKVYGVHLLLSSLEVFLMDFTPLLFEERTVGTQQRLNQLCLILPHGLTQQ